MDCISRWCQLMLNYTVPEERFITSPNLCEKPGFHCLSWRPELTGPSTWPVTSASGNARLSTRLNWDPSVETGHPSTHVVETGLKRSDWLAKIMTEMCCVFDERRMPTCVSFACRHWVLNVKMSLWFPTVCSTVLVRQIVLSEFVWYWWSEHYDGPSCVQCERPMWTSPESCSC